MKKINVISLLLACALLAPSPAVYGQRKNGKPAAPTTAQAPAPATHGNAEAISAAELKDYLAFIASDELEGRDTPSRGLDTAAKFIATHLSHWGLKPAGDDGTYFQRIALTQTKLDPALSFVEINGQRYNFGEDYLAGLSAGSVSGPLVYAGSGWVIKAKNIDAYQGVDVKDKIVVLNNGGLPKGVSFNELKGKQGEDFEFPVNAARKRGAKGVIFIPNFQTLANWDRSRQSLVDRGFASVDKFQTANNASFPTITVSPRTLAALFQGEKLSAMEAFNRAATNESGEAFEFKNDKKVKFTIALKTAPALTQNVVATLEGSDPTLKNEYVAIGAHYDHVGIGTPVNGDPIYNGADDDGSGTVSVLALADAFSHGPRPKRSILFIWHAGEEKGLWGSQYFTDNPTVPISQIITELNIDMIGRTKKENDVPANQPLPKPGEIYLIGSKMMSTELGEVSEAVNKSYMNLTFNYKYDDPNDPERFFYRSDHYNYARKGVPIIFYMDGVHEDYHRPSDTYDKIDYQNMEKVARTIYATGWELANRPNRPRVDKPLPAVGTGN
jgi:Zn-dependent M28 family amino/carboxypeptidase